MNNVWVILNETKDVIVTVFETDDADSSLHWPEFYLHKPGCVFCGRTMEVRGKVETAWYYNYFYWGNPTYWGHGQPDGIGWSAVMTLPEPIKMLNFVRG
jgi:hypothetical protein